MGSDASSATLGNAWCHRKSTELQRLKNSAASAQNDDFYCKKWSFALLLLTNPLPYTIRHNISMGLVAIGGPLSLTLGRQRVIIMVVSVIFFFWILDGEI
jgi:hypothetical protein